MNSSAHKTPVKSSPRTFNAAYAANIAGSARLIVENSGGVGCPNAAVADTASMTRIHNLSSW